MTCGILLRNCAKLNINCRCSPVVIFSTTKWQSRAVSSATIFQSSTRHNPPSVDSVHSEDVLNLAANRKYTPWTDSRPYQVNYAHLILDLQPGQIRHLNHQRCCYSTKPGTETESSGGTASTQVEGSAGTQLSQREKLKRAVKEYGSTVVIFHVAISLVSLGGFYLAVSSGIDMVGILKSVGVGESILQSKLATGTGTFVVAYAVHKVFAPARIGITLTSTPFIVRYLRSKGILKPPKPQA